MPYLHAAQQGGKFGTPKGSEEKPVCLKPECGGGSKSNGSMRYLPQGMLLMLFKLGPEMEGRVSCETDFFSFGSNRNTDSFGSVSVFFPKEYSHLFWFVSVFRNRFETNRNCRN
jgi:hypothetical protein